MSSPSDQSVAYSTFLANVQKGQVTKVEQQDLRLTVTPAGSGPQYTVVVPGLGFTNVYDDVLKAGCERQPLRQARSSSRGSRRRRPASGSASWSARCCRSS